MTRAGPPCWGVLLAGLIYLGSLCSRWCSNMTSTGDEDDHATAIPALRSPVVRPHRQMAGGGAGLSSCFASINIYLQGFARLIWSMAREGLPVILCLSAHGQLPCMPPAWVLAICFVSIT